MIDEKVIKYVPPHGCTKRDTEIQDHSSKDKDVLMLEKGQLVSKRNTLPSTSTSDALKLHNCLIRRALAFDISGLISFNKLHFYHQHLLSQLNIWNLSQVFHSLFWTKWLMQTSPSGPNCPRLPMVTLYLIRMAPNPWTNSLMLPCMHQKSLKIGGVKIGHPKRPEGLPFLKG